MSNSIRPCQHGRASWSECPDCLGANVDPDQNVKRHTVYPPCHDQVLELPIGSFTMSCGCEIRIIDIIAVGPVCYLVTPGPHLRETSEARAAESVPTYPCPKCGVSDTWMRYERDGHFRHASGFDGTWCGSVEHFDRGCRRCKYEWATSDVISSGDRA